MQKTNNNDNNNDEGKEPESIFKKVDFSNEML